MGSRLSIIAVALLLLASPGALAIEHVSIQRAEKPIHLSGKVLVEGQDGGLLLLAPDGVLWVVQPDEIQRRKTDSLPFKPFGKDQISQQLLKEMGDGFRIYTTANFVICYNTSLAYAKWCGGLYERLYRGFRTYWSNLGIRVTAPEMPLTALVFRDQASYALYARRELGTAINSIPGYYSLRSNRVIMYDLTGVESLAPRQGRVSTSARVNQILSQPEAIQAVATIVHEATHLLAFNCGLHQRYADVPKWVSEGIAIYFETPDLRSSRGWKGIGNVNRGRLIDFLRMLRSRHEDSLQTLLRNNKRIHDVNLAPDAYAEAWALTYFLIRTRRADYVQYLQALAEKKPVRYDEPQQRIEQFIAVFGNLDDLDSAFIRYMKNLDR